MTIVSKENLEQPNGHYFKLQRSFKKIDIEKIFFMNQDQASGRYIAVEENENYIWAYLTFRNEFTIEKDCFLGSREQIELKQINPNNLMNKNAPPPMVKKYSNARSFQPKLKKEDISIDWSNDGNVVLKINEEPFLFFIEGEKKGFSRSIGKNGVYGNAWNEQIYNEHK